MGELIGELFQNSSGLEWEWQIPGFLSLPEEVGKCYRSREFFFSGACWELCLYPNGLTKECEGWVSLFLFKRDSGPPLTVVYAMGVRKADGTEETIRKGGSSTFSKVQGFGVHKFLQRTDLVLRRDDLAPSELLTVTFTLKDGCRHSMQVSLCRRLWNTSVMLQCMLTSEAGADVTFKLEDGELRAHILILMARSKAFTRMFALEREKKGVFDGEVHLHEADKDSFNVVLTYMYTGIPQGLSPKNMCKVFAIAHRYELGELVTLCVEFMKGCLTPENVCDVIQLADQHQATDLKDCAREFVLKNGAEVVNTDEWKALKRENSPVVSELLEMILVKNVGTLQVTNLN